MMESCIQPLNFRTKYTKTEIEAKGLELKVSTLIARSYGCLKVHRFSHEIVSTNLFNTRKCVVVT